MALRLRFLLLAVFCAAAVVTLLVSVLPFARFAYRSISIHIVIETLAAVVALFVALLVYGRFREGGRPVDLLLVPALGLFAVASLAFAAVPTSVSGEGPGKFAVWAPLFSRLAGAGIFAAAAFVPDRPIHRRKAALSAALGGSLALAAGIAAATVLFAKWLPVAIDPALSPEASIRPLLIGDPAVLSAQGILVTLFALAAIGFARRAEQTGEDRFAWFAVAATLATFARINYLLFPSLYSEWVYTGDFFRLSFYVVLLLGAAHEIDRYWRRSAEASVLEERRRIARDLHDGLAQELAFIVARTRALLAGRGNRQNLELVVAAAERALDESRNVVAALAEPFDEPLDLALTRAATEVAGRAGAHVRVRAGDSTIVQAETRETLVRIVREAVTNATRHGHARNVSVEVVTENGAIRLRVSDDGVGFQPEDAGAGSGFGLVSMAERAHAAGGRLDVRSQPGLGTEVEVALPR